MKNTHGFTLIELLVALVISSLLISGIFTLYLNMREHHQRNDAIGSLSEEINFLHLQFRNALQSAGYLGKTRWSMMSTLDNPIALWPSDDPHLPDNVRKKIKPNTQALEVQQMHVNLTSLAEPAITGSNIIIIEKQKDLDWNVKDYVILASFYHAEIHQIIAIQKHSSTTQQVQLAAILQHDYASGDYAGLYLDRLYFIGDTGQHYPDNQPIYGLYMNTEDGMTEEISDVVSQMDFSLTSTALRINTHLTLPTWIEGKPFSKDAEFFIALRE